MAKLGKSCGLGCLAMVLIVGAVIVIGQNYTPSSPTPSTTSSGEESLQAAGYIRAGGNLWTGVKLYYGSARMYCCEVLGGNERYVSPTTGERFRGLKVLYPDGKQEWKDRSAVNSGPWYVRRDDPALQQQQWRSYQR